MAGELTGDTCHSLGSAAVRSDALLVTLIPGEGQAFVEQRVLQLIGGGRSGDMMVHLVLQPGINLCRRP